MKNIVDALREVPLREGLKREDLTRLLSEIKPLDLSNSKRCRTRWNTLCKPLYALGELEEMLMSLAGIQGTCDPELYPALALPFFADNGVVAEGVSQCGQEVTAQVLRNMQEGKSSLTIFAKKLGVTVCPVDVGTSDYPIISKEEEMKAGILQRKINANGTGDLLKEPAMSEEECLQALFLGYELAKAAADAGVKCIIGGEMGIANTTTSTALVAAHLNLKPDEITGRGAGLSDEGLARKKEVIQGALDFHKEALYDPFACLQRLGGLDLAALTGLYLGATAYRIPVILDGLITYAAALTAIKLKEDVQSVLIPSHLPREGAAKEVADYLGWRPYLDLNIALGEGAGALLLLPLLELALEEYEEMPRFDEGQVEQYEDFSQKS